MAAEGPPHQPRQTELGEAAVGEVADADDPHGRQVTRPALGFEDRRQFVDEALRPRVTGSRPADDDGRAVAHKTHRIADRDQLAGRPGGRGAHRLAPPALGLSVWPVNSDARSLSRKITASATSSARPNRPNAMSCNRALPASLSTRSVVISVRVTPGATALMRTPLVPNSRASERVNPSRPAIAAL